MKPLIRYKTKVPFNGYSWEKDPTKKSVHSWLLKPNLHEGLQSFWLPEYAYLEFIECAKQLKNLSLTKKEDIESAKQIIMDFTLKYGSLLPCEDPQIDFDDLSEELGVDLLKFLLGENYYNSPKVFISVALEALDLYEDYEAGLHDEVAKELNKRDLGYFGFTAELQDGRTVLVYNIQWLFHALMFQLVTSFGNTNPPQVCLNCGKVMNKKKGAKSCSDSCRAMLSQKRRKLKKEK